MKTIKDLEIREGTKVLLRLDYNVPINSQGEIENTFRIDESLTTIKTIQDMGTSIIIIAHKEEGSLEVVSKYLESKINNFKFSNLSAVKNLEINKGDVVLLENIRLDAREKSKEEERDELGKEISELGDVFINDAFSASHRNHASIVSVPKFLPSCLGPNFIKEVEKLSLALEPKHPTFLILGGAKFDTKLKMLEKFISISDKIFVGGALAHSFWKAKGYSLGTSLIDEDVVLNEEILGSQKIILPKDVILEDKTTKLPNEINSNEKIVDFGEKTLEEILKIAEISETIVWNGPLGFYEKGYFTGTAELIKALGKMQNKIIILGGGDTVAVLSKVLKENPELKFTHVSSAGGAMIDFLSTGTLPGIQAIK